MRDPRENMLEALEEILCARQETRPRGKLRDIEPSVLPNPDLEGQILDLVRADRVRTTAVLQQAIEQLEQLDARLTRTEARARESEALLEHLYKCSEAHNEAKDMLKHLYRRIEAQLTGVGDVSGRGAFGRSAA